MKTNRRQQAPFRAETQGSSQRPRYWRWMGWFFLLLVGIAGGVALFAHTIVEWALKRMEQRGLFAELQQVEFSSGRLRVRQLLLVRHHPQHRFQLKADSAELVLSWWEFLTRQRHIAQITVQRPQIEISQHTKQKKNADDPVKQRRRLWRKQRQQLLQLDSLHMLDGALHIAATEEHRRWSLHLGGIRAHLRQFSGEIEANNVSMQAQDHQRDMTVKAKHASVRVNLDHFLGRTPPMIEKIALQYVSFGIKPRSPTSQQPLSVPRPSAQRLALVPIFQQISLQHAQLDLQQRTKQGRLVHIFMSQFHAQLQNLDPLYFWIQPVQGEGRAVLSQHYPVSFQAKVTPAGGQSLWLPRIPIAGLLTLASSQQLPIRIEQGHVSIQVRLHDQPQTQQIQASVSFQVQDLQLDLIEHQPGLKGMLIRAAIKRIHRYFQRNPDGYRLLTTFSLDRNHLLDNPEHLLMHLSKQFIPALLEELRRRHPILRPFLPLLRRKWQRSP